MEPVVLERTRVRTADGELDALIHYRPSPLPQPGLVLVDGSGDGIADGWGSAVDPLVLCGTVVLTHDKAGCGDSPGDWRTQSLADRADESLAAAALLSSHPAVSVPANICYQVRDPLDLALIATALCGSFVGFLWWNTTPAKIIMGDTGSLALGGAIAGFAILSRTQLLLVVMAGLFVMITLSVIIQVTFFKLSGGKRVFLMTPLHHHFELKGWEQVTAVARFWIIAGLFVAVALGIFYAEWVVLL